MLFIHMLAQAAAAATPEAAAAQGVISYPASFFAAQQPANAAEMVERVPGFSMDTGSGARGFEGAAGNVLIDGKRPASKTDDVESILRRIPASRIERIDLIRGGAPGIDMQGKTVVANIIRKEGGGFTGLIAVANNHTWDDRNGSAARIEGQGEIGPRKWELGLYAGKFIDDGAGDGSAVRLFPGAAPDVTAFNETEGDGLNGQVTGTFETPLAGGSARFNGRLFREKFKYEDDLLLRTPTPGLETYDEASRTKQFELGVNYSRPLTDKASMEMVGLRQQRDRTRASVSAEGPSSSAFSLDRETTETIGRAVLKYRFDDKLSFEGGGEFAVNELDSVTVLTANGAPVALPAGNVEVAEERGEVFAKATWRPIAAWTIDSSLRWETSTISSDGDVVIEKTLRFLKPRLSASWDVMASTQLRFRVERQVGQLNFDDFVATPRVNSGDAVTAGNPDLDPEQAWVGEAAVEQRFWGSGSILIAYRHFELKDAIDRGPITIGTSTFDRPANIGDGTKDELSLEWNIPFQKLGLRGLQLRGDLTRRWSEVTDPTTGDTREISGLHPLDWNAYLTQDIPNLRLNFGVNFYGAWRETYYRYNLVDTTKLRTFVHPFIEWKPKPDIHIRFEAPNASARGLRRNTLIYPGPRNQGGAPFIEDRDLQPGRSYYIRVRKTFGG